ncbi:MAG: hypothetical protein JNK72_26630 [Myxococcales bacterium]|nr:hypothetical protein [Myxococcales bacterium]
MRASVALVLAGALGCGRGEPRTPEATVRAFVSAVSAAQDDANARERVYHLLSGRTQETLQSRAQLASQVSGFTLQPWEMLAPGRMRLRVGYDPSLSTTRVEGDRAWVTVRGPTGGVAEVPLLREGGRWRVELGLPAFRPVSTTEAP